MGKKRSLPENLSNNKKYLILQYMVQSIQGKIKKRIYYPAAQEADAKPFRSTLKHVNAFFCYTRIWIIVMLFGGVL